VFEHKSGHVEFVVDKAVLGQVFFRILRFQLPIIPPIATLSSLPIIIRANNSPCNSGLGFTPPQREKILINELSILIKYL
jgi:hypothetical protein